MTSMPSAGMVPRWGAIGGRVHVHTPHTGHWQAPAAVRSGFQKLPSLGTLDLGPRADYNSRFVFVYFYNVICLLMSPTW